MVPTLLRRRDGAETDRAEGWDRARWRELSGVADLGADLTDWKPGCGSRTHDPAVAEELLVRTRGHELHARRVELAGLEDEAEALYDRGWTDGLPVVAPTPARVLRMLAGTSRAPDEVVATVPPNLVPATVEKVAINAVLAGCRPEYLPVVLAAVEAACAEEFNAHGLLATTWGAAPGGPGPRPDRAPDRDQHRGQRAGAGHPGELDDRAGAAAGDPQRRRRPSRRGRPRDAGPARQGRALLRRGRGRARRGSRSRSRAGCRPGASAVTVFAAEGAQGVVDQISRTPGSLARSLARGLRDVGHPKIAPGFDAVLVVVPEHAAVFAEAGWDRARLHAELDELLLLAPEEIARGADGIDEGMPAPLPPRAAPEVPARRADDRRRRRGSGEVLRRPRRLGRRPRRQHARHPRHRGGPVSSLIVLDPTDEARPAARTVGPRPDDLAGRTVGLLDISKPRGEVFLDRLETLLAERGRGGAALRQADLHPPRARRPARARSPPSATW